MATTTREPLSRDRILRAALELVDEGGVEALTMRKLGETLGYEAMSLYRHVENKDDVLGGILDLVLAEWTLPAEEGDWMDAVRASAVAVHAALRRHPWAAQLLMQPQYIRPGRVHYMEALLARLRSGGLDADSTYHVYHVLDGYTFGFSLWERSHTFNAGDVPGLLERLQREIPFDRLPHLAEHRDQHLAEGPHRQVSAFEFGLDLILNGLRG
jgi:AcrR family transcriptional regulator